MEKCSFSKYHTDQLSMAECGVACLQSIFKVRGLEVERSLVKEYSGTSNTGTSLLGLCQAANKLGLSADGYEGNIDELKKLVQPSILHVIINSNQLHYIVCYRFDGENFIVGDPARGIQKLKPQELDLIWKTKRLLVFSGEFDSGKYNRHNSKKITNRKIRFWDLLEPDMILLALSVFFGLIAAILSLSLAYFTQLLLNDVLAYANNQAKFVYALSVLIFTFMIRGLVVFFREIMFLKQNRRLGVRTTEVFFGKLLNLPMPYFQSVQTGDILTRMNDIARIQSVVNYSLGSLIIDGFVFITVWIFMFALIPSLGMAVLFISVLFVSTSLLYSKKIKSRQRKIMELYALNETAVINSVQTIEVIKMYNKEAFFTKAVNNVYSLFQAGIMEFGIIKNQINLFFSFLASGIVAITVLIACHAYFNSDILIGTLVALIQVSLLIVSPVTNISFSNLRFQEAKVAFERLNQFADEDSEYTKKMDDDKVRIVHFDSLDVKGLSFKFPGTVSLIDDLDMHINKGEIVALVGKSGQGKSTFFKILQMFYKIPKGKILVNDMEWNNLSVRLWREIIGVVPQEIKLFNSSVAGNISLEEVPEISSIKDFCKEYELDDFFESLAHGYSTVVGETGVNLSGGQKQLLGLARALYKKPHLLLLDEATSFLDTDKQEFVFQLLKKIRSKLGTTILYITHDSRLIKYADRCVYINQKANS